MKALTLYQPWATHYRGPIAIHAGKHRSRETLKVFAQEPFRSVLRNAGYSVFSALPLGGVVCVAELTAIYNTEQLYPKIGDKERHFGNYAPGRYAWRLENVRVLAPPVPAKGAQGLWEWNY